MSADPLEAFIAYTRGELTKAGLERVDFDGNVYWRGGSGDVVVLLHGVNDQAGTWSTIVPLISSSGSSVPRQAPEELRGTEEPRNFRLVVPDLAGHGDSEPHEGPIAMSEIVARMHAILERETASDVTLVGNSMGGWVAMLYALDHPERVARLVLESASGMTWPVSVPLVAQTREQAIAMLRAVHGPAATIADWMIDALLARATSSPMLRVAQSGVLQYLLDAKLPSLTKPATLIWGADDGVLPVAYAEALRARLADARLHVIDGAAHIPHRQQPERFVECLNKSFSPSAHA